MMGLRTKSAVVVSVCLFVIAMLGCDDEKKSRCCKCNCFQVSGVTKETEEKVFTLNDVTDNCDDACRHKCETVEGMTLGTQTEEKCAPAVTP